MTRANQSCRSGSATNPTINLESLGDTASTPSPRSTSASASCSGSANNRSHGGTVDFDNLTNVGDRVGRPQPDEATAFRDPTTGRRAQTLPQFMSPAQILGPTARRVQGGVQVLGRSEQAG